MSEEKTEAPSEFRLREARKKGQVAKSADISALASMACVFLCLAGLGQYFVTRITQFFLSIFQRGWSRESDALSNALPNALDLWMMLSLPLLLAAALGAVVGNVGQFGFLLTSHPITPDLKKINPIEGFKKLFSKQRLVELLKQIVKFTVVFSLVVWTIRDGFSIISMLFRIDIRHSFSIMADFIGSIVIRVLLCFSAIAIFDFFWQRHSFLQSMKMSKEEVKKEYKQQEGDPHVKQERRRIQQETLEAISVGEVSGAAVVITNPSHLAIALKYEEDQDDVPRVIAKGAGRVAKKIIEQAKQNDVPIMRNVPLARDLLWLEINEEIPKHLYDSVAEVLTFIYELNNSEEKNENSAA